GKNDGPLARHILRVNARVDHPVCLDLERQIEMLRRERLEIDGEILRGEAVIIAPIARGETEHVPLPQLLCSLEKHVLDPVRDPGDPRPLVPRADPVPDPARRNRRRMALLDQDFQTIIERYIKYL